MAASARLQKELEMKSKQALATTKDPLERLRAACLARGAQGIKGLSMYVFIFLKSFYIHSNWLSINLVCLKLWTMIRTEN